MSTMLVLITEGTKTDSYSSLHFTHCFFPLCVTSGCDPKKKLVGADSVFICTEVTWLLSAVGSN